jgi:hypothetical protein
VPAVAIDEPVLRAVEAALAGLAPVRHRFNRVRWFGEDVAWVATDADHRFRAATDVAAAAFPDHPPYGGAHDDPTPHLTIGHADEAGLIHEAARAVASGLPVSAEVSAVDLWILGADRRWAVARSFSLG